MYYVFIGRKVVFLKFEMDWYFSGLVLGLNACSMSSRQAEKMHIMAFYFYAFSTTEMAAALSEQVEFRGLLSLLHLFYCLYLFY